MLSSEDDPEAEENGIEDALANVAVQHHERHVDPQRQPINGYWKRTQTRTDLNRITTTTTARRSSLKQCTLALKAKYCQIIFFSQLSNIMHSFIT